MQVGSRVLGSLSISADHTSNESLTSHDQQLLRMLADYAAIAIQNMRLVRQTQLTKEREKQQIQGLLERYVASPVVKQALASPGTVSLGGTRQTLTILFADVRGFSTLSAQISPEVLIELLNQYMRVAADAILDQEGTLDKFMGDAVMAWFNAPIPQEDHTLRAVKAAIGMRDAVNALHKELPPQFQLGFGAGIHHGPAVLGLVGTEKRIDYTAIGDSVNTAKRIQENAAEGQILITADAYAFVKDQIQVRQIEPVQAKGKRQPIEVYELLDLK